MAMVIRKNVSRGFTLLELLVVMVLIGLLAGFVVPRFSGIYEDIGGELPLASKMLMQWGRLRDAHGLAVLAGFLACVAVAVLLTTRKR